MITPKIRVIFGRKAIKNTCKKTYEIEVYYCRQRRYFSTGVALSAEYNGLASGIPVIRHPDAQSLNRVIEVKRAEIAETIRLAMVKAEAQGLTFTLDFAFPPRERLPMVAPPRASKDFRKYIEERIKARTDITESTRKNHYTILAPLDEYGKIRLFGHLTPSAIKDFDQWLHCRNIMQSTIGKLHRILKTYIHEAMAEELLFRDPYVGFKVNKGKSKVRKYLSEDDLKKIMLFTPADSLARKAKDLFVVQCFTGFAYVDLMSLDSSMVVAHDGRHSIRIRRKKTGEPCYIVLLPPALAILERYNYKLPQVSNQKYNQGLKTLAAGAGIDINLTSHCGRHTAATMFLTHGMPLEVVSKVLGHTSTKTTEIYAQILSNKIDAAFDAVEARMMGR